MFGLRRPGLRVPGTSAVLRREFAPSLRSAWPLRMAGGPQHDSIGGHMVDVSGRV